MRIPRSTWRTAAVFEVADVRLEVLHTPGHSRGAVCIYCEDLGVVFSGDTLLKGRPGPHGDGYPDFPGQLTSIGENLLTLPGEHQSAARARGGNHHRGRGEAVRLLGRLGPVGSRRGELIAGSAGQAGATLSTVIHSGQSAAPVGGSLGEDRRVDQLGFEGMPQRLYPCTPSRLTAWLDCPRRYRMTYLDRPPPPKGPPWAHNSLGASVHNALAGWWRLPLAERTATAAGGLLERGWITEGFADAAQSASYRAIARQMVEAYVGGLDPADEPVGVERTVATKTDRIALSGRIDRLDERAVADDGDDGEVDGTELVVVDYKTGRHLLTVDDARSSMPLALYALAAERVMRRRCRRVELHHLPTGRVLAWVHSDEALSRQLRRATEIAAECADADERYRGGLAAGRYDEVFPPNPRPACGWCDYLRQCPEGMAGRRAATSPGTASPRPARGGRGTAAMYRSRKGPALPTVS